MLGACCPHCSAALLSAVLLLHIQAAATVRFQVLVPTSPLSAPLGGMVLLTCHLSPALSAQAMQVEWSQPQLGQDVHVYLPDGSEVQGERYRGRTELLQDGIQSGSLALRIRNLALRDEGRYLCDFQSNSTIGNATLELRVTSAGLDPLLHVGGYDGKQMNVMCLSVGWYPKPKVLWRNGHRERLTPSNEEKISRNRGLFDVSSYVMNFPPSLLLEGWPLLVPVSFCLPPLLACLLLMEGSKSKKEILQFNHKETWNFLHLQATSKASFSGRGKEEEQGARLQFQRGCPPLLPRFQHSCEGPQI
ncbi:unnamed protein product, partial [Caretta caretta]